MGLFYTAPEPTRGGGQSSRERKCADTTGTVPVTWAGCPRRQNISTFFINKIYGNNFVEQHSETAMVRNYHQTADCSLKIYGVIYCNFRHTFDPYEVHPTLGFLGVKGREAQGPTVECHALK